MKIGLDYHGVLDKHPDFFSNLTTSIAENAEIHIVTGAKKVDFMKDSKMTGIFYSHFYSITDEFLKHKIPYNIDEKGNPSFDKTLWDSAKAMYCASHKIDIMIDDSKIYGKFFTTPYTLFK